MKPLDFPLLSDENIAPDVVAGLRARGCDLLTAWDEQLIGRPDVDVLERATSQGRVVVTHDLAFGRSAIRAGTPFIGIVMTVLQIDCVVTSYDTMKAEYILTSSA